MHRVRPLAFLDTSALIALAAVLFAVAAWTEVTLALQADVAGGAPDPVVAFADDTGL